MSFKFFECLSLEEAQEKINHCLTRIKINTEQVSLHDSLNRYLAEDIFAKEDLPNFSKSTVDGYAVRSLDTFGSSESTPSILNLIGEVEMGKTTQIGINGGEAMYIPTGGAIPPSADAVVMKEYVTVEDDAILIFKSVGPNENLILKGEDIKGGTLIYQKGTRITASIIGLLAAIGFHEIAVYKPIQIGIISTGDELVDINNIPTDGKIRDINSHLIAANLSEVGCKSINYGIIKDVYQDIYNVLVKAIQECQIVIISGGSSVGSKDFTVRAMEDLAQKPVCFHGITIKPGKPTIYSLINDVPIIGLPGHPVSAIIVLKKLVIPLIKKVYISNYEQDTKYVFATLTKSLPSAAGRDDFIRVKLIEIENGFLAEPIFAKSGVISSYASAKGLIHIKSSQTGLDAQSIVKVELL